MTVLPSLGAVRRQCTCAAVGVLLWVAPVAAIADQAPSFLAGVAADHPTASEIGARILDEGGHAVDAAVATAFALGVLNNFASGIGGGGFALVYDHAADETRALDFRETAPSGLTPAHLDPLLGASESASRRGGLASGVPSEVVGLWTLHQQFGRLPWESLLAPAIELARGGFDVHPLLAIRAEQLGDWDALPDLAREFGAGEDRPTEGARLVRSGLADALEAIADTGPDALCAGPLADDIVHAVQRAGGVLAHEDLCGYQPVWRPPTRIEWGGHLIDGMPLPSSGAEVLARTLHGVPFEALRHVNLLDAAVVHRLADLWQHAFAVRARFFGDPDRDHPALDAPPPPSRPLRTATTSSPDAYGALLAAGNDAGTSHLSVVDRHGNAVALTTTVNTSFGSGVVSPRYGVLLNNQMDDFAVSPGRPNAFGLPGSEANRVEPGRRPLSSMTPLIVRDDGGVRGVLGASGGPTIITATTLVLLRLLQGDVDAASAVAAPRFHHQWLPPLLFVEAEVPDQTRRLLSEVYGYSVTERELPWAVQAIWRVGDTACWTLGSDPRKRGAAAGAHGACLPTISPARAPASSRTAGPPTDAHALHVQTRSRPTSPPSFRTVSHQAPCPQCR